VGGQAEEEKSNDGDWEKGKGQSPHWSHRIQKWKREKIRLNRNHQNRKTLPGTGREKPVYRGSEKGKNSFEIRGIQYVRRGMWVHRSLSREKALSGGGVGA